MRKSLLGFGFIGLSFFLLGVKYLCAAIYSFTSLSPYQNQNGVPNSFGGWLDEIGFLPDVFIFLALAAGVLYLVRAEREEKKN